jgi:hypothetical protein
LAGELGYHFSANLIGDSGRHGRLCRIDHLQVVDIFISYSKQSKADAGQLAGELQARGFTVWYDTSLVAGDSFGDVIMSELSQARAAIVIWDQSSVKSEWVRSEASRARARRILVPVRTEGIRSHDIPPPFDSLHTELLSNRPAIDAALAKLGVTPVPGWKDTSSAAPASADDGTRLRRGCEPQACRTRIAACGSPSAA